MRLALEIDALHYEIDSTDPELLGKWIIEIFGRFTITPATYIRMQASPSWLLNKYGVGEPDWTPDRRIVTQSARIGSPRELVEQLGKWLDEAEAL